MGDSLLARAVKRVGVDEVLRAIPREAHTALMGDWRLWARPEQLPPAGDWRTWLLLAGRGFGKTRTGAETVRRWALDNPGCHIALVAPTAADARDVMVRALMSAWEGGRLDEVPVYEPSKRSVSWPNGSRATTYSADEPDRLRGPQHHFAWADELAAWRYEDAWDQLQFGLRLGQRARVVVTTTPRPTAIVRALLALDTTVVTRGSTFDNAANLDPHSLAEMRRRYEGTRLGRQELYAEILDDVPGALWQRQRIDELRVRVAPTDLVRVVVAVDPAVTTGEDADETGIMVAGKGADGHAYVLADLTCKLSPDAWARRAVGAYRQHDADRLVAEVNNGGDLVERVIRTVDPRVSYRAVRASRGKVTRAEPVAALYEQGRVHHVGSFAALEDQQCRYVPDQYDGSPDRVDALVWALTDLMLGEGRASFDSLADVSAPRRM